jgi:hypothetical protein
VSQRQRIEKASLVALFVLLIGGAALAGWLAGLFHTPSSRYGEAPPRPTSEDYRVGAIMFVPTSGPNCEVYRFDNKTGQVEYDSKVNCERNLNPDKADAFAPGTERRSRMNSVLGGFRKPGD